MDITRCEDGSDLRMIVLDFNRRPILRARSGSTSAGAIDSTPRGNGNGDGASSSANAGWTDDVVMESGSDEWESDSDSDGRDPDVERAMRRLGRVVVESGNSGLLDGMSGGGERGEWACFSRYTQGMVLSRLPFRAFQREGVQGYLDWIVGMDHLVGISVSAPVCAVFVLGWDGTDCVWLEGAKAYDVRCDAIYGGVDGVYLLE